MSENRQRERLEKEAVTALKAVFSRLISLEGRAAARLESGTISAVFGDLAKRLILLFWDKNYAAIFKVLDDFRSWLELLSDTDFLTDGEFTFIGEDCKNLGLALSDLIEDSKSDKSFNTGYVSRTAPYIKNPERVPQS